MKNKILTLLIFITAIIGYIISLIQLYAPIGDVALVTEGSYYYLGTTLILFILALLIQNPISKAIKITTTLILTLFGIFGFLLALIALYASPLDYADPYAAAIFFLAGMLGGSIIPMIKIEKSQEKIEIGKVHKIIRIVLLIIIVLSLVRLVLNIIPLISII